MKVIIIGVPDEKKIMQNLISVIQEKGHEVLFVDDSNFVFPTEAILRSAGRIVSAPVKLADPRNHKSKFHK